MAIGIHGIDEQIFLDLFEGNIELYVSVLNSFVDKAPKVVNGLRNVSQGTLTEYTNNIHGLKGVCANICAEDARKKAADLEKMGRAGDLSGVLAVNEAFLKYMMEELMPAVQKWLKDRQG